MVTEWEIHEILERRWNRTPFKMDGMELNLVASEVMPDVWGINDPRQYWASPSIDFVFLGKDGTLWLAELKNRRDTLNDAWNSYCQVVYAEFLFTKNNVSTEALSLVRSRYVMGRTETTLGRLPEFNGTIRCMLIVSSMRCWKEVEDFARTHSFGETKIKLRSSYDLTSKRNLPMSRFCAMPIIEETMLPTPVLVELDALYINQDLQEVE